MQANSKNKMFELERIWFKTSSIFFHYKMHQYKLVITYYLTNIYCVLSIGLLSEALIIFMSQDRAEILSMFYIHCMFYVLLDSFIIGLNTMRVISLNDVFDFPHTGTLLIWPVIITRKIQPIKHIWSSLSCHV